MKVKIIYELDIDVSDFDPERIDIPGITKDLAQREMESLLKKHGVEAEDFEYIIEE